MAILGTVNGYTLISTPTAPGPQSVEWTSTDTVATSINPFTQQSQIYDWQASVLEATITMPPLTDQQARSWIAFLLQAHGQANAFFFGDPLATQPLGTPSGTPTVNGASQTGYTLSTHGWTSNATNLLLAGDWIQIGTRLYRNLDTVNADASGNALLNIWPNLRESPTNGAAINTSNTRGLFRLKSNQNKWSITDARTYGITYEIREAI